jgi:CRISPR/Cas system-associated endonuclease/helicase Cas3
MWADDTTKEKKKNFNGVVRVHRNNDQLLSDRAKHSKCREIEKLSRVPTQAKHSSTPGRLFTLR